MAMYVMTSAFNAIASSTIITPTSENALYPRTRLYDGRPSRSFRFNAVGNNVTVDFDFQGVLNGGFENDLLNWINADTGTGVSSYTTVAPIAGVGSLLLTSSTVGGANRAVRYQDIVVPAGAKRIRCTATGNNNAPTAGNLQDLTTGLFLQSNGTWGASGNFMTAFVGGASPNISFTVASATTLRLTFSLAIASGSPPASGRVDSVLLQNSIDFFSLHGHNMPAGGELTIIVKSSDTDPTFVSGTTTQATLNLDGQQTIYTKLGSPVSERYWRVQFGSGGASQATTVPIEIGEMVFGQVTTLTSGALIGYEFKHMESHLTSETRSGEQYTYPLLRVPRRVLTMQFLHESQAAYDQALDVFRSSRGSAFPLIIVPDSTRSEVIYGRMGDEWSARRTTTTIYSDNTVIVTEVPLLAT